MKISSVNLTCPHKMNNSFKGLWGKTSLSTDIDPAIGTISKQIKYYYPFINETKEQVTQIIEGNKKAEIIKGNGSSRYVINDCRKGYPLSFTEDEFENYRKINETGLINPRILDMHKEILNKYITDLPIDQQESAENKFITYERKHNSWMI